MQIALRDIQETSGTLVKHKLGNTCTKLLVSLAAGLLHLYGDSNQHFLAHSQLIRERQTPNYITISHSLKDYSSQDLTAAGV